MRPSSIVAQTAQTGHPAWVSDTAGDRATALPSEVHPGERRVGQRVERLAIAGAVCVLVLPALVLAMSRRDTSVGDIALIELRTRDVLSAHPPLTGVYSRYGWSHPGPLMYYVYALPYRVLGSDADALRLAALLVNVVFLTGLVWLAYRRGRAATVAIVGATVLLVWGMLPHSMSDSWNVTIAMVPLMLTVVGCWSALCGDRWALPIAAVAAVFVAQAHIGFGVVTAPLFVMTFVWVVLRAWRGGDRARLRECGLVFGGCVLLFVPVMIDALAHWPGNLVRLLRWSASNDEPTVGVANALRMIGRTSSLSFPGHPRFPGVFVTSIDTVTSGFVPGIALLALVAATLLSRSRGWRDEWHLCVCVCVVWLTGLVAATTITRPLAPWLIDWLQPLGWITYAALALVVWRWVQASFSQRSGWPRAVGAMTVVAVTAFVAGSFVFVRSEVTSPYLFDGQRDTVEQLSREAAAVDDGGTMAVEFSGDTYDNAPMFQSLVNELDRAGVDVCVPGDFAHQFGDTRTCRGDETQRVVLRYEQVAERPPPDFQVVTVVDPLSLADRDSADTITARLVGTLTQAGHPEAIPLVYTTFVDLLLADGTLPSSPELTADVQRLRELRSIGGARFALYLDALQR